MYSILSIRHLSLGCGPTDTCILLCGYTIDVVFHCNHAANIEIGLHGYPVNLTVAIET